MPQPNADDREYPPAFERDLPYVTAVVALDKGVHFKPA